MAVFDRCYTRPDSTNVVRVRVLTSQFEVIYRLPDGTEHRCQESDCPAVDEVATDMLLEND